MALSDDGEFRTRHFSIIAVVPDTPLSSWYSSGSVPIRRNPNPNAPNPNFGESGRHHSSMCVHGTGS